MIAHVQKLFLGILESESSKCPREQNHPMNVIDHRNDQQTPPIFVVVPQAYTCGASVFKWWRLLGHNNVTKTWKNLIYGYLCDSVSMDIR